MFIRNLINTIFKFFIFRNCYSKWGFLRSLFLGCWLFRFVLMSFFILIFPAVIKMNNFLFLGAFIIIWLFSSLMILMWGIVFSFGQIFLYFWIFILHCLLSSIYCFFFDKTCINFQLLLSLCQLLNLFNCCQILKVIFLLSFNLC